MSEPGESIAGEDVIALENARKAAEEAAFPSETHAKDDEEKRERKPAGGERPLKRLRTTSRSSAGSR